MPGDWHCPSGSGVQQSVLDDAYLKWMLTNISPWRNREKLKQQEADNNVHALLTDLKYCSMRRDLQRGRRIHLKAVESRHDSIAYIVTALIRMYSKCGSMAEARSVFDSAPRHNVVSWTALLLGYADNGDGITTLEMFSKMKACGCEPDCVTYVAALKACTSLAEKRDGCGQSECLKHGRQIHSEIGCHLDIFVQNTLIDMYAKCGSMRDARLVFDSIHIPTVVSWTALLLGYAENGDELTTLELFLRMKAGGCTPDSVTYVAALKACTSLAGKRDGGEWLERGRQIHSEINCDLNTFLQSTLIDMYGKCGSMVDARRLFDSIRKPGVVSWNALLLGYAENGDGLATLDLFLKMKSRGCTPNSVTYMAALKACTSLAKKRDSGEQGDWLIRGKQIHSEIGCDLTISVQNTLINMYGNLGSMVDARRVFGSIQKPNVVSWTALLMGYADNGDGLAALDLFSKMKACRCVPDSVTYIAVLKACGLIGALSLGRKLHSEICEFTAHVVTCLVYFYASCGSIQEAREVFDAHSRARDVSTWTALLAGYGSFGDIDSVFNIFEAMQDQGYQPNTVTFVSILSSCSHAGLTEKAREFFEAMPVQYGVTHTVMHYNCMVDILGRINQLEEASTMIRKMPCKPDAVTWMTLLSACRKWKNVEIGTCAFQSLMNMDNKNAPANALMADIYGSRGMWDEQAGLLERIKAGAWKLSGQSYAYDEVGNMVTFVVGKEDPPEVKSTLEQLKGRATAESSRSAAEKELLCSHSERRAVAYGISRTPLCEPVRAFKNMKMCDDCHESTKLISKIFGRMIMIRDASRFHVMVTGSCSCGDYW